MFKMMKEIKFLMLFGFIVALAGSVSAFGVAHSQVVYPDGNFIVTIQNPGDTASFVISDYEGVSFPQGTSYVIEAGGFKKVPAKLNSVPPVGSTASVSMKVSTEGAGGETVALSPGVRLSWEMEVLAQPDDNQTVTTNETDAGSSVWWWVIGIIVLILIIWLVLSSMKKKR